MCQALCQGLGAGGGAGAEVSRGFIPALRPLGEVRASLGPRIKGVGAVDGAVQTGSLRLTSPKDHTMSAQQRELDSHRMHQQTAPCQKAYLKTGACRSEK